jgi:hypothetical protein
MQDGLFVLKFSLCNGLRLICSLPSRSVIDFYSGDPNEGCFLRWQKSPLKPTEYLSLLLLIEEILNGLKSILGGFEFIGFWVSKTLHYKNFKLM